VLLLLLLLPALSIFALICAVGFAIFLGRSPQLLFAFLIRSTQTCMLPRCLTIHVAQEGKMLLELHHDGICEHHDFFL
jgi:hypothetical protein